VTVIKIEPFSVKSIGGIDVTITGIDPTDPHGVLSGTYNSVNGIELGRWSESGILANGDPKVNLSIQNDEVREAIETAKAISK
jgi:hypothetical protein